MINKKTIKIKKGFSLIEVMISFAVLYIGLVGITKLMVDNVKNAIDSRDQIIAASLAQEEIELLQNIKDTNRAMKDVDKFHYFPAASPAYCRIDRAYVASTNITCTAIVSADAVYKLKYDTTNGYTSSVSTNDTRFYRRVEIVDNAGVKEITVYVTWNGTGFAAISSIATNCSMKTKCLSAKAIFASNN